ncbi:class I SAM-dependent methyltransferase [Candidatus Peregrinibacteria bacterium]|jgi:SAM-dependent methyltransferase|nr:class I SAM-dependent methyltransferase [Candidatus Peregrinibacteria bacterium]MBT7736853.1 class I SAM-dependent methyltransferase [Candidatus Peregrinibacteria bacterium]
MSPNDEALSSKIAPRETGYGDGYQQSVDIECRALFGMTPDEMYRRQTGLVTDSIPVSLYGEEDLKDTPVLGGNFRSALDVKAKKLGHIKKAPTLRQRARKAGIELVGSCDLDLGPGKRVLDIASGEGDSSRYLSTTGADVVSRDLSGSLVKKAIERDLEIRNGVREGIGASLGDVTYNIGDMGDIGRSFDDDSEKFDVVSCMGRSFIYLLTRENYESALCEYFDLLNPGGKIVLQGRECVKGYDDISWSEETKTGFGVDPESGDSAIKDLDSGVDFVWRKGEEIINEEGVKISKASRYLRYPDGKIKELKVVDSDEYFSLQHLDKMADMLKKAGFVNVGLKAQELSRDGSDIMFALVAEKPKPKAVGKMSAGFGRRILNRLRR